MFSVVILFHHWFPLVQKVEILAFIVPRNFPAVLIIFTGRVGAGNPPLPTVRGGARNLPLPAGRVPRGAGRPSLVEAPRGGTGITSRWTKWTTPLKQPDEPTALAFMRRCFA